MSDVRRIVVFTNEFSDQDQQCALLQRHGARIVRYLRIVNAVATEMTDETEKILSEAPEVLRIDSDEPVVKIL